MDLVCLQCCLESIVRSPSPVLIDAALLRGSSNYSAEHVLGAIASQSTPRYEKKRHLPFESLLTFSIILGRLNVFHFILTKV
jgi:hypothetical protein